MLQMLLVLVIYIYIYMYIYIETDFNIYIYKLYIVGKLSIIHYIKVCSELVLCNFSLTLKFIYILLFET